MEYGENMAKEELDQQGLNYSLTHVDFMIGSSEMNMDGETTDKRKGTPDPKRGVGILKGVLCLAITCLQRLEAIRTNLSM
jgi:hypothetical protein